MKSSSPIILMVMFAVALGAGIITGKLAARGVPISTTPQPAGTLSEELHLSPDQRAKMEKIWQSVSDTSQQCLKDARQVQLDQDVAMMKLLNPDQQTEYKRLCDKSVGDIAVINQRRKQKFDDAIQQSLPILDKQQRDIYLQIVHDRGLMPDAGVPQTAPAGGQQ